MKRGPLGGPLFGFRRFIRFKGFRGGGIAAFGGDEYICRLRRRMLQERLPASPVILSEVKNLGTRGQCLIFLKYRSAERSG
jgi:hypothetical protein